MPNKRVDLIEKSIAAMQLGLTHSELDRTDLTVAYDYEGRPFYFLQEVTALQRNRTSKTRSLRSFLKQERTGMTRLG